MAPSTQVWLILDPLGLTSAGAHPGEGAQGRLRTSGRGRAESRGPATFTQKLFCRHAPSARAPRRLNSEARPAFVQNGQLSCGCWPVPPRLLLQQGRQQPGMPELLPRQQQQQQQGTFTATRMSGRRLLYCGAISTSASLWSPQAVAAKRSLTLVTRASPNLSTAKTESPDQFEAKVDSTLLVLDESDSFSRYSGYVARSTTAAGIDWDRYDAEAMALYFRSKPLLVTRRLVQISSVLGKWLASRWLDAKLGRADVTFKQRASELRRALVQLGPAFVKIAQAVSSRPDVIPPEYLQELSLLQDRIAPFSTAAALDIMEEELGVPVDLVFSEISPSPVAAASLGQVYQARLRPNGQEVAVKVQRPGVREVIALDIFILRILAGVLRSVRKLNTDLQAVVDEWAASLFREMDYEAEARNGIRFRKLFGGLPSVLVPRMYPELTTRRVLVMDWVEGQRLSEVSDPRLVEVGVYCSLSQLLDSGFYHADPHPGNLLRTPDGRLAYLDFGMMGEMDRDVREALIRASVHLVNREFESLAADFVSLGLLPRGAETEEVAFALTDVFRDAIRSGVRNMRFGNLGAELGRTMYRFKFRIPPYFSLVVRSLTVLEGIALKSDPNYKVLATSYPWIAKKVLTDQSPQLRATLKTLLYKDGQLRVDRLESLLQESTRPMLSAASDAAANATGSTRGSGSEEEKEGKRRRMLQRVLKFALSDEGSFIRDVLLDEVAKGMDAFNRMAADAAVESLLQQLPAGATADDSPLAPLLQQYQPLSDGDMDAEHVSNLRRLIALLVVAENGNQDGAASGDTVPFVDGMSLDDVRDVLVQAAQLLSRAPSSLNVFLELPLTAQQTALLLPGELAGRVVSRTLARGIRRAAVPL